MLRNPQSEKNFPAFDLVHPITSLYLKFIHTLCNGLFCWFHRSARRRRIFFWCYPRTIASPINLPTTSKLRILRGRGQYRLLCYCMRFVWSSILLRSSLIHAPWRRRLFITFQVEFLYCRFEHFILHMVTFTLHLLPRYSLTKYSDTHYTYINVVAGRLRHLLAWILRSFGLHYLHL
jgi:hypothetical protein